MCCVCILYACVRVYVCVCMHVFVCVLCLYVCIVCACECLYVCVYCLHGCVLAIVTVLCSIETGVLCVQVTCALANEPLVCFGVKGVRFEGKEGEGRGVITGHCMFPVVCCCLVRCTHTVTHTHAYMCTHCCTQVSCGLYHSCA